MVQVLSRGDEHFDNHLWNLVSQRFKYHNSHILCVSYVIDGIEIKGTKTKIKITLLLRWSYDRSVLDPNLASNHFKYQHSHILFVIYVIGGVENGNQNWYVHSEARLILIPVTGNGGLFMYYKIHRMIWGISF